MAKILFIEDDPLILKIYSTRLSADGHEVLTAGNGEEGVQVAQQSMPQLIVLDIMMPKMDGFAVLKELRGNAAFQAVPILVYSNLGREDEMAKAKDLGATESIIKANISPTEMVKKIKQYLGTEQQAPAPQNPQPQQASSPTQQPAGQQTQPGTQQSDQQSS